MALWANVLVGIVPLFVVQKVVISKIKARRYRQESA
jgi:hypothetical protein